MEENYQNTGFSPSGRTLLTQMTSKLYFFRLSCPKFTNKGGSFSRSPSGMKLLELEGKYKRKVTVYHKSINSIYCFIVNFKQFIFKVILTHKIL